MEIEKPNTFLPDLIEVVRHAHCHNAGLVEYLRTLCLYLFGTPVGRWGRRMPPPAPGVVRVRLYMPIPAPVTRKNVGTVKIDQVDFPLEADGGVDLGMIKRWFGIAEVDVRALGQPVTLTERLFCRYVGLKTAHTSSRLARTGCHP
ncbi:hypothetical protein FA95DRAFT_899366 [Auriscalpium vulgare]|uniref:Uncharacterized protein n=1 Tax=Auriscalpium vulgare TaxID=40419 RepID=A0ACB8R8V4_9AGAM|nr:hypothetical protein FA95DRAFT_899366 [Auriscalpium vulgare]